MIGPQLPISDQLHADKYRQPNESFEESMDRIAAALADNEAHRAKVKNILHYMRFMPAGRIQSAVGSSRDVTAFNCFVSGEVEDSLDEIFAKLGEAAATMKQGGGVGFDFSLLRPSKDRIVSLDSTASGPVSFMEVYDAMCKTIMSAGHRRGAMMGVMRVDHPDIEMFIRAKQKDGSLNNFNISVGVTDEFMDAVEAGTAFTLRFEGKVYKKVDARALWDEIMRANWDWAEPGVLFIDTINKYNNLWYCETIAATNPCGEQPLPPYGACLLGSFNLAKYVIEFPDTMNLGERVYTQFDNHEYGFDFDQFKADIPHVVRAIDNVIDISRFPLPQQQEEALAKRRMGLGITGLGSTLAVLGLEYGSEDAVEWTEHVMKALQDTAYRTSIELAKEKGSFPLLDREKYLESKFFEGMDKDITEGIRNHGIRNSHLISIAPAGTISFCADNVSSGLEPIFANVEDRTMLTDEGPGVVRVKDYAYSQYGVKGMTTAELSVDAHLAILSAVVPYVDSAISKTINIGDDVNFQQFKEVYMEAYKSNAKGCTTFRLAGKRFGIRNAVEEEGAACFINADTGQKECG